MDLKLGHYSKDGIEVVTVGGEIDIYTAPRLRELLIDLAGKNSYQLVINMDKVGFLDSTGLGVQVARPGDTRVTDCPGDCAAIARMCGWLPLALRIIAALLAEDPARPLDAMTADLRDEQTRLDELSYGDTAVRAAFDLSYQRLDPGHVRLFRLLTANVGPDISTPAAVALTGQDRAITRRGLEALARAHLIEHGASYGRWRLHDVVRLYGGQHGQANAHADRRDEGFTRLLEHYLVGTKAATAHLDPAVADPAARGFRDREQALAWLDAEYPNLTAAASSRDHEAVATDLALAMSDFLLWRRHFNDWIILAGIARDAARRLGDRHGEAMALGNLGIALEESRRFPEAITACQDAAQIFREIHDKHGEAVALTNLGVALQEARRFPEAITACQDAAQIHHASGDRQGEAAALNSLGTALGRVGRFEEAITASQDAAQIFRETRDRHGEAAALGNLGLALHETGRFPDAITACQNAAQIYRETHDKHGVGMALNSLGAALREVRRFREAITACQDAAQIYRETCDKHNEGFALGNLGLALREARRFREAITASRDAAQIFRETRDEHSEAAALNNLGIGLQEVGQFQDAITAHYDAAQIYRKTRDKHNEDIALANLGVAQQAQLAIHQPKSG